MVAAAPTTSEPARDYLTKIEKSAVHLLGVVNSILDFSKIEARKVTLEAVPVHLPSLFEEQRTLAHVQCQRREVDVRCVVEPTCPPWVLADPVLLAQVVANLLSNAVKFTLKGAVTLRLELVRLEAGEAELRVAVEDTGVGMTAEALAKLFVGYAQGDASIARRFGGTGLGLMISKGLVELMGGRLEVRSTPNVGSCFSFTLRLPVTSPPAVRSPDADWRMRFAGQRVLLAEDNPVNQLVSRKLLEKFGFEVTVVPDGQEAVAAALDPNARFAIVLMDVNMPVVDGLEATRRIRARLPKSALPIVALTANAFEHDRLVALAAGMDGYVAKPIELSALQATLWSVLGTLEPGERDGEDPSAPA